MRLNYRAVPEPDGSTTVVTRGPISRIVRLIRIGAGSAWLVVALIALVQGAWEASGIALIIGAVLIPKARKDGK